jgi:GDSL-like Lipase/Acylhydrolase
LGYFINHNGSAPPTGLLLPESTSTPGGGITWDRWVSNYTNAKLYNYAVSGAVCDNNQIFRYLGAINGPFPDVVYEVNAFIADSKFVNATTNTNTLYTNRKSDNTVYSMWIGTNDLGNYAFLTDSSLNKTTITDYVDCIYSRFDQIYANGGRYFVLMNTAPLELSPLYGVPGQGGLAASHYWPDKVRIPHFQPIEVLTEFSQQISRKSATR